MTTKKLIVKDADGNTVKLPLQVEEVEVETPQEVRKRMIAEGVYDKKDKEFWRGLNRRMREDDKERVAAGILHM